MQRNLRDTWSWRGALTTDELEYEPVLADAVVGPITAPASAHWPLLVSHLDVAARVVAEGRSVREALGPIGLYLLLFRRSGGVHAFVPEVDPDLVDWFEDLRRGEDGVPDHRTSVQWLIASGMVERSRGRLALVRPPSPTLDELHHVRVELDRLELDADLGAMVHRVVALAWDVQVLGPGGRRYRELARFGRLAVTIAPPDAARADPKGYRRVGPTSLPELTADVARDLEDLHPARGWISAAQIEIPAAWEDPPLLIAAYEIAALLLGPGAPHSVVDLRRAVRATALWTVAVARTGGKAGQVRTSVSQLTREFAELVGLAADGDHRTLVAQLLEDLVAANVIRATRLPRGLVVEVLRPPVPSDQTVREFLVSWKGWRLATQAADRDRLEEGLRLAGEHLERYVREPWRDLLEEGRVTVRVMPGEG